MLASPLLNRDEAQILHSLPFLDGIPAGEVEHFTSAVRRRSYRRGDLIHHEDDLAGDFFIVLRGHVKHRIAAQDGRQITHKINGPGRYFGMLSLLDHKRRAGDAVALTDCELLAIDSESMSVFLDSFPGANASILKTYVGGIRRLMTIIHDLAFLSVPMRLAKILLDYAEEDVGGVLRLPAYLNQLELAFLVGTTRESVNQTLKRFAREGWISFESRTLTLTDADALRRSLNF
jgi:CRP/FNR family cyclic AMP-dependent transcriptional regulator